VQISLDDDNEMMMMSYYTLQQTTTNTCTELTLSRQKKVPDFPNEIACNMSNKCTYY